jgi:two-component system nitrogen regulation response regulator GlnG
LPTGIYDNILRKVEKPLIYEILKATKGNKKKAATVLGINRNTLAKKISDLNIILEE